MTRKGLNSTTKRADNAARCLLSEFLDRDQKVTSWRVASKILPLRRGSWRRRRLNLRGCGGETSVRRGAEYTHTSGTLASSPPS